MAPTISSSTIVTIGLVVLFVVVLKVAKKTFQTIVSAVMIALLIIIVVQATTGKALINLNELGAYAYFYIVKFAGWLQDFLPNFADAIKEVGDAL